MRPEVTSVILANQTRQAGWSCPACDGSSSEPWFARHVRHDRDVTAEALVPSADQFGRTVGELRRCRDCRHVAVAEPPAVEVLEGAYHDTADEVSLSEEDGQVRTSTRDLQRLSRWRPTGRLLDVGCWTGSLLVAAETQGWNAHGVEPSAWACDRARARGCNVTNGFLSDIGSDGRYEAIVAADVIEHLPDPHRAVTHLGALLVPGGTLMVMVPDAGSIVARSLRGRWWSVLPMHLQYFNRRSMRALLSRVGLEVVDVRTHPKAFSVRYYADRLAAFVPGAAQPVDALVRATRTGQRTVAPDLRDRMIVIARRPMA